MPCYCLRRVPNNKTLFTPIVLINSPLKVKCVLKSEKYFRMYHPKGPRDNMKCNLVRDNPFSYPKKVHMACTIDFVFPLVQFAKKGICENLTLNVVSTSQITFVFIPQRS